jgi:hypothetical protein
MYCTNCAFPQKDSIYYLLWKSSPVPWPVFYIIPNLVEELERFWHAILNKS